MRNRYTLFALAILIFSSFARAGGTDLTNTQSLIRALIRIHNAKLDITHASKGCKSVESSTSSAQGYDLGDYLSFLISRLDSNNGKSGVSSECEKKKNKFSCEINFSTGLGTESPWTYGVQFQMDNKGNILSETITCPGA